MDQELGVDGMSKFMLCNVDTARDGSRGYKDPQWVMYVLNLHHVVSASPWESDGAKLTRAYCASGNVYTDIPFEEFIGVLRQSNMLFTKYARPV